MAREAALEVAGADALPARRRTASALAAVRARAIAQLERPREPDVRRERRGQRRDQVDRRARGSRRSSSACRPSSRSQVRSAEASATPARTRAEQRVALRERLGVTRGVPSARAGHSAATSWSRCARRSAGVPFTSSRRSGTKTQTSGLNGDVGEALDRRAVGRHALRLRPARSRPPARARRPASRPSSSTRAAGAPKRTSSRSLPVRHELDVQAKNSASTRFVLPAPFGPWITVSRSPTLTSRVLVGRGSRAGADGRRSAIRRSGGWA